MTKHQIMNFYNTAHAISCIWAEFYFWRIIQVPSAPELATLVKAALCTVQASVQPTAHARTSHAYLAACGPYSSFKIC